MQTSGDMVDHMGASRPGLDPALQSCVESPLAAGLAGERVSADDQVLSRWGAGRDSESWEIWDGYWGAI